MDPENSDREVCSNTSHCLERDPVLPELTWHCEFQPIKKCLNRGGCINNLSCSSIEVVRYQVRSSLITGDLTKHCQLILPDLLPDLNHSGIYNMKNCQQTYAKESIFESCSARMSDHQQSQQREDFKKLPQIMINFSYLCSVVVRKLMRKTDKTDENKHDELSQSLSSAAPISYAANLEIYNKLKKKLGFE